MSSKHPFVIGITRLRKAPGSVVRFELLGRISDLKVAASRVSEDEDIAVAGTAESVHGGILITATISTRWNGECRRCLEPAFGELEISVRELFERAEPGSTPSSEGDTYPYTGDFIDLQDMVKDQIVLELPLAPVCKADCKGLCPSCGADLNLGPCGCEKTTKDPRWSVLDVLAEKDR